MKIDMSRICQASALANCALRPHRFGHWNKTLTTDGGLKENGQELMLKQL